MAGKEGKMEIERHIWQPNFPNEIWIKEKISRQDRFTIILKQGADIEIEFDWDYGYAGRGTERMTIPVKVLTDLLKELEL